MSGLDLGGGRTDGTGVFGASGQRPLDNYKEGDRRNEKEERQKKREGGLWVGLSPGTTFHFSGI